MRSSELRKAWLVPHAETLRRLLREIGAMMGRVTHNV